ncbi:hypothetical protein BKA58DRAFT_123280 [Alternaria rosae]|uniref:uncharacterized protein n=1 Tax=Alternaria rosae TaxID=1187941 RepID=UPI001E8E818E|nr:uncharacterized protein BKA58DRAFT_123280 [Alternaria rosae]KAH6875510.1 hypothetical protein BKA58DRAFT_123280 [Alternaria rosae]
MLPRLYTVHGSSSILITSTHSITLSIMGLRYDQEAIFLRIAIIICHEVAHAIWYHRSSIENLPSPTTTHNEPLYQLVDISPELGDAWERYIFGGNIWTIDYPGKITTYYYQLDATTGRSDDKTRIIVPRWWVHIFFLQPIWTHFSRLHHQGLLRLPTELESGCAFRKHSPEPSMNWTIYTQGAEQEQACMMTRSVPYLLWNLLRPALERLENCNKFEDGWERPSESKQNRKEYEEMCRSLVDQAAASHTRTKPNMSVL